MDEKDRDVLFERCQIALVQLSNSKTINLGKFKHNLLHLLRYDVGPAWHRRNKEYGIIDIVVRHVLFRIYFPPKSQLGKIIIEYQHLEAGDDGWLIEEFDNQGKLCDEIVDFMYFTVIEEPIGPFPDGASFPDGN